MMAPGRGDEPDVRPDGARQQAALRSALAPAIMVYLLAGYTLERGGAGLLGAEGLLWALFPVSVVLALSLIQLIRVKPGRPIPVGIRLALAVLDVVALAAALTLGGRWAVPLCPVLAITVLGGVIRLGAQGVAVVAGSAVAATVLVIAVTPFWRAHPVLSATLLLFMVALPVYTGLLTASLHRAKSRAESDSAVKSRFLSVASHELRTPLHAIRASAGLLESEGLPPRQAELLAGIRSAGDGLLEMVDQILDLSAAEAGRLRINPASTDLLSEMERLRAAFAGVASARGLGLVIEVEQNALGSWHLDAHRLRQVLTNLLGNAFKFTTEGGAVLRVCRGRKGLWLSVEDSGPGIPVGARRRIFEAFERGTRMNASSEGSGGLGLSIAREIAEAMGGQLRLVPAAHQGCCFVLELPAAQVAREPAGSGPATVPEEGGPPVLDARAELQRQGQEGVRHAVIAGAFALPPKAVGGVRMLAVRCPSGAPAKLARARAALADLGVAESGRGERIQRAARPGRVLLAEDNAVNRAVTRRILSAAGHEVMAVDDGAVALAELQAEAFDVALLDVNMDGLSGIEVSARNTAGAVCIAFTADITDATRERCLAAGMLEVVVKPVGAVDLLAAVARGIDLSRDGGSRGPAAVRARETETSETRPAAANRRVIAELADLDEGDGFASGLVQRFLGDAGGHLDAIAQAADSGDREGIRRRAHALAGAAGNVGADRVRAAAKEIEAAPERSRDDIAARVGAMSRDMEAYAEAAAGILEALGCAEERARA